MIGLEIQRMSSCHVLDLAGIDPVCPADCQFAYLFSVFGIKHHLHLAVSTHSTNFHRKRQAVARKILPEIKVLVPKHRTVLYIGYHPCENILFGDITAAFQDAGYLRRCGLVWVQRVLKAQRGHLDCRYSSVFEYLYLLDTCPPRHYRVVGHAVVEDVPLPVYIRHRTVVVAARIINAVVDYVAPVGERTSRRIGCGVCKPASLAGRVYQVISAIYLSGRTCFKETLFFGDALIIGYNGAHVAVRNDGVHISGVYLVHIRLGETVVYIDLSVIVHQHTGIVENAVITDFFTLTVKILTQQFKRTLRLVRNTHRALRAYNIGIKIIFAVLFYDIGGIALAPRPGSICGAFTTVFGAETVAVTNPVIEVIKRCAPHFQLVVTEHVTARPVMRTVQINSVPENSRLGIGYVFPQR